MNLSNYKFLDLEKEQTPEGKGVLNMGEFMDRYKKKVDYILDENIFSNYLTEKEIEEYILDLAPKFHREWLEIYKTEKGVLDEEGNIKPRPKDTIDKEWIKNNGGITEVDIANTPFSELPNDWKEDNLIAARQVLTGIANTVNNGGDLDDKFVKKYIDENHILWLKKRNIPFNIKKGELDYDKDYNNGFERKKDEKNLMLGIETFLVNKLSDYLGSYLHSDWLEIYKTQDGNLDKKGNIKPRIKETNDKIWIEQNNGNSEVDIANTPFSDLPKDWKEENIAAAKNAINIVFNALENGEELNSAFLEKASSDSHDDWLRRNPWVFDENYGNPKLAVNYYLLEEKEKDKNRVIIKQAIKAIENKNILFTNNKNIEKNFDDIFKNISFKNDIENLKLESLNDIENLLKFYKNSELRESVVGVFLNYFIENSEVYEENLDLFLNKLSITNVLLFYKLIKDLSDLVIDDPKYKNISNNIKNIFLIIEEKYDKSLIFRYFRYFARTRYSLTQEELKDKEKTVLDRYGDKYYDINNDRYYNIAISNDMTIVGDKTDFTNNSKIGDSYFCYLNKNNSLQRVDYKDLFEEYLHLSDVNSQESDLKYLLQLLHNPTFMNFVENQFGFKFEDYPFAIQPRFMQFLSEANLDDFDRIKKLFDSGKTKKDKFNRINSFIGTYYEKGFSKIILSIGESNKLTLNEKNEIFEKYNSLIDELDITVKNRVDQFNTLNQEDLFSSFISNFNNLFKNIEKVLNPRAKDEGKYKDISLEVINLIDRKRKDIIESGVVFKELKDKEVNKLEDLNRIGIEYKDLKLSKLDIFYKKRLKSEILSLYLDNYDEKTQGDFLEEIKIGLDNLFNSNNEVELKIFYIDGKPILSSYLKHEKNGELYYGGLYGRKDFQEYEFGFWVTEKILEENSDKIINAIVFKDIQGIKNRYKALLRSYKGSGFDVYGEGSMDNASYFKITNNLYSKKEVS